MVLNSLDVSSKTRILVITGTTGFDSLVKAIDQDRSLEHGYDITFQIGEGQYQPVNKRFFSFDKQLNSKLDEYDFFITHAGAGTIFGLLENNRKVLVVPNTERADKHQTELAHYVKTHRLCAVCEKVEDISNFIKQIAIKTENLHTYQKIEFSAAQDILRYIYE